MKAKCLQIFVLAALTPVKMQTTRGKNLAKSLTEQRKKLWQESGKQETSFHLCRCQNELRQLSWGNTERVGKHTACTTPRWTHAEGQGQGQEPCFSSHLPPPEEASNQTSGTIFCALLWLSRLQNLQRTVLTVVRVTALETVPKNTTQNNTSWWELFLKISFWLWFIERRQLPLKIICNLVFSKWLS